MKKLTSENDLIVGEWYWLRSVKTGLITARCDENKILDAHKHGFGRLEFLEKNGFEVYGPIPTPDTASKEIERLRVTSAMKAEFHGEFLWVEDNSQYDENGKVIEGDINRVVPWDLCKRIYKEMLEFALTPNAEPTEEAK